jgi:hypothetical protein
MRPLGLLKRLGNCHLIVGRARRVGRPPASGGFLGRLHWASARDTRLQTRLQKYRFWLWERSVPAQARAF